MKLLELLEGDTKDLVIIYPGRFHPFHIGHGKVYKYLKQKYSNAKVFIATSGKTDNEKSPFTFDEKRKMMMLAGVDASAIVQTRSPYAAIEIVEMFDPDKTVVLYAISEKDMENEPRFNFSNGVNFKKNGEPAHMQKWEGIESADTVRKHSYIATTPTFPFTIRGAEINSASQIRNMISKSDDTELSQILQDLYNVADIPQDVLEIFKRKIGNSTMNENWSEDLTSAFLIEDNTMATSILQALTESEFSPKQIKMAFGILNDPRYKDGNYDGAYATIEKIAKGLASHPSVSNALKRANESVTEWVQEPHEGQKWTGQEINFIQDLCKRHDGIQMQWPKPQTGADGIKGPSPLWDKGNIMSNDADLQKLMTWVEQNKHDVQEYFKSEFRVYGKDNDDGQSDGNQILSNIMSKIGSVVEARSSASDQAAKAGAYNGGKSLAGKGDGKSHLKHKLKGKDLEDFRAKRSAEYEAELEKARSAQRAKFDAMKEEETDAVGESKNIKEGDYANDQHEMLEYIHHVLQECGDGNMDITMVEQALEYVEEIREQHFNADGSTKNESIDEAEGYESWVAIAEKQLGRQITNEEKEELKEFWPAVAAVASRIPPSTFASAGIAVGNAATKAGKWIKSKLKKESMSKYGFDVKINEEPSNGSEKLEDMQKAYEYNEDRNAHSENILMLVQAFGKSNEVKAIQDLLKTTKQQGYVTPDQSKLMYDMVHKKYYSKLFPVAEGYTILPPMDKERYQERKGLEGPFPTRSGKVLYYDPKEGKYYDPDSDMYLSYDEYKQYDESVDHFTAMATDIAIKEGADRESTEYKAGSFAAKHGKEYKSNPHKPGRNRLNWSMGHNEYRAEQLRKAGKPNYGARGQFESK